MRPVPVFTRLLPLVLLSVPVQEAFTQSSGLGLKAGGQMNTASANGTRARPMFGGMLGLYGTIYGGAAFEIQPELLVSMHGRVLKDNNNGYAALRLYYAQLPITLKYFFGNTFNVQGGPQIGKLIGAAQLGDTTTNVLPDVNPWDMGFNLGLAADMHSGWDFTLRYYNGLSSVILNEGALLPVHRSTQISVGYRFKQWRHKSRRGRVRH
ncbi:MAG: PorT family protein [Flavobacteriales bacterium]|nr:MAG: PorT family protein [Flavobacteriales bacterium]